MQLNQLKRQKKLKKEKIIGRGGKRGKTSGRGTKGQRARAGHRIRPQSRDVMKRLPKLRGFKMAKLGEKFKALNVKDLEAHFEDKAVISPATLLEKKLVKKVKGKIPPIKILGAGDLSKSLNIKGLLISKTAKEKVEKAGGVVEV